MIAVAAANVEAVSVAADTVAMPKVLSSNIDLNSNLTKPANGENGGTAQKNKKTKANNLDGLKSELAIDEHRITLTELCERFSTNLETVLQQTSLSNFTYNL